MSKDNRRELDLTASEKAELRDIRDHHAKPHWREKAAAILKIASGQSVREVACEGLLRRRNWKTVARWLNRYEAEGVEGFAIRKGRGRKPAYEP